MEIRLARQSWESAFFIAWNIQEIVSVNLSDSDSDIVLMFFCPKQDSKNYSFGTT
jgi:hypothetical protein